MKKHILIIARNCPFPTTDGEKLRVYNIIKQLSNKYTLTLVYRIVNEDEKKYEKHLLSYCHEVFSFYIAKPKNNIQRLRLVLNTWIRGYPLVCAPYFFPVIYDFLSRKLSHGNYDAVQIENSLLFPYLDSVIFLKNGLKVVTVHNIDFKRFKGLLGQMPFSLRKIFYLLTTRRLKKIELLALKKFDVTITMSEMDKKILSSNGLTNRIITVPNGVDTNSIKQIRNPVDTKNIIFVGSLDYEANKDGVLWFIKKIWPRVCLLVPEAKLTLVGKNPGKEILKYQSDTILVTGMVENVKPFYESARACIVPLRAGGGTRLKILEALAYGIPIISTTIGCEGIHVSSDLNIMIADTPSGFALAIVDIVKDNDKWKSLSANGRKLVDNRYSWGKVVLNYGKII